MYVPVNEHGLRIGEYHHRAKIADAVVNLIRDLHEDRRKSYQWLANKFRLPTCTVAKICRYERRNQIPDKWKRIIA